MIEVNHDMVSDLIFEKRRSFIIAEVGNNHNGDLSLAKRMIDSAIECGADCVKFQMRNVQEVYRTRSIARSGEDLGTEYIMDLLDKYDLCTEQHLELKNYCDASGIIYLCTPWDTSSANILNSWDVPAFKVASADMSNRPLLKELVSFRRPLIISTGMSSAQEIIDLVNFLKHYDAKYVLLHCNSTYPAPFHDINLRWMSEMKKLNEFVGYSGHERGIAVSIAAVALGATVIERHFTFDKAMEGPDHAASLLPFEFKNMVDGIREVESALGSGLSKVVSQGEMINRENLGKSIVAARPLLKGDKIKNDDLKIKSPGQGLAPSFFDKLIGKTLKRNMAVEDFFYSSDLSDLIYSPKQNYDFRLKWGLPVRFHDFAFYTTICSPKIWEFHLSYRDMLLDPGDFIDREFGCDFAVHAPELFSDSMLMDLTCESEKDRAKQLDETQKVIDLTRDLKRFFPKTSRPLIIANIGGFSTNRKLSQSEILKRYEIFGESLKRLDLDGVELIPQTMAPFPWHFGGQRFQNLFMTIEDIIEYCHRFKLRMCFDVSHSALHCNYSDQNIYEFAAKIAPITAHVHFGDAKGLNGEGLQIGSGEINFLRLSEALSILDEEVSFIPEIWQGHKDSGSGFWQALDTLEGMF